MLSLHLVLLFLFFATTPSIFQHSRIHIQCLWENDDISLTVDHKIHSVDEKLATEKNEVSHLRIYLAGRLLIKVSHLRIYLAARLLIKVSHLRIYLAARLLIKVSHLRIYLAARIQDLL
jgi:hypothetical protein